ncbi:MAG TPA: hypothetical protein VJ890_03340 [Vineibacter sp.]|nr:hypothetical protein [Vineibacter sp.]
MTNVTFFTARESDAATIKTDVVGSFVATLPASLVQDPQPTYAARSSDATTGSTQFDVDAGTAVDWDGFFLRCDLSAAAQIELVSGTTQGGADQTTGVISVWPTSGRPTTPPGRTTYDVLKLGSLGSKRWRRVKITDTAHPNGRINIGRMVWGKFWRPQRPHGYGTGKQVASYDLRLVTPGGHTIADSGQAGRLWSLSLPAMIEADAEDNAEDLAFAIGIGRDVVVCLDPDATTRLHRHLMLATLESSPQIERRAHNVYATVMLLRERI